MARAGNDTTPDAARAARAWLHTARFLTTVAEAQQLPPPAEPEIAFVGRSNVGKSSAINALTQQTQLAHASGRPGRTRHINLFAVGRRGATDALLADLPGYGYAAVPLADKARWQRMLAAYVAKRPSLRGLVLLCDARHGLRDTDRQVLELIRPRMEAGVAVLLLLTKCDKLSRAEQARALAAIRTAAPGAEPLLFSATKRTGLDAASQWLARWSARDPATEHGTP